MNTVDISWPILPSATAYPGDAAPQFGVMCDIGDEAPCRITELQNWTTHFLTHVDAPRHFLREGATLDDVPLSSFYGETTVIEVEGSVVKESDIPAAISGGAVFFKTRNSMLVPDAPFDPQHVFISEGALQRLVSLDPVLVGFDYLSVDRYGDEEFPIHLGLLSEGILILEGLRLGAIAPGEYAFSALPLSIPNGDGSPVRAILRDL